MKKKKRKLKIRSIIVLLLIIIFLFTTIKLLLFFLDLSKSKKDNDYLAANFTTFVYTNEEINTDGHQIEAGVDFKVDFDKLKSINSDTIGWIRFNKNKVNNPIVHTFDNQYYINKSFQKNKNQNGTIFMDYRNNSFEDKNVVLFGHSIYDETMFGSLKNVLKEDFFNTEENNYILINDLSNNILKYQIFSYYIIDKEEYYITTNFKNSFEFLKFLSTINNRSYKNFNVSLSADDHLLTLSTCAGTGNTKKRLVIHAKKVD